MRTHVTFVLDSSGSMSDIRADTIGGFNTFLEDQQDEPGKATVTLYDFNNNVERIYRGEPIKEAPKLDEETYVPGGQTALHDAITTAVTETDRRIEKLPADIRPDNVIMVALTDGKENASETPQDRVRDLVENHRKEHGWEFLFIGANQDAALTASKMGMDAGNSLDYGPSKGTYAAYQSTSDSISRARESGETGGFTEEDRNRQEKSE